MIETFEGMFGFVVIACPLAMRGVPVKSNRHSAVMM
jgi:hypothetical protein